MLWWASPAHAQSLLQQLFGLSPAPQAQPMPRMLPQGPIGGMAPKINLSQPQPDRSQPRQEPRGHSVPREGAGSFTTVCVRLCDGFYFPVSHRASSGRFQHDAELCRTRCGQSEARLFYYPSAGGSMNQAVDLNGRAYTRLKTAFLHRKQLVSGCGCKPEPWSAASVMRHQVYAINEGLDPSGTRRAIGTATVVAGLYPDDGVKPQAENAESANGEVAAAAETSSPTESGIVPTSEAVQQKAAQTAAGNARPSERAVRAPASVARSARGEGGQRQAQRGDPTAKAGKAAAKAQVVTPRSTVRVANAAPAGSGSLFGLGGGASMRWPGDTAR